MVRSVNLNDVKEIFEAALDLAPGERAAYLDTACGSDDVRQRVEHMLASDACEDWMDPSTRVHPDDLFGEPAPDPGLPERLGRYSIRRRIAVGGMGSVYEGVQDEPRRIVAIKVMRRNLAQRSAMRRFRDEAQILSRLRHPAIAQIFDAAMHRDAQDELPYFVMEFVPGARSITKYARERELGVRDRLALFIRVCEGVHHGHQKGVVHRDLKPDNILVDGAGHPKIIDFGVARATDADVAVTTMQADVGQLIGTLQYMSPEQLDGDPRDIDTRSDVYALGAVLFELCTDETLHDVRGLSVAEAVRVMRETSPARMSSIQPKLRGDLETIVEKALERDRERRYQSALELAQDLGRYLIGEAIAARPPSLAYHLRVAARRHRPAAFALGSVLLVVVAAALVSTVGFVKAQRQLDDTQQIARTLSDALRTLDPRAKPDDYELAASDLLDEIARRIEVDRLLSASPLAEADLRATIGVTYRQMNRPLKAEPHLRRSLDIRLDRLGEVDPRTIETMYELGLVLSRLDRVKESDVLLAAVVGHHEAGRVPPCHAVAASLRMLGYHDDSAGERGVELCEASLEMALDLYDGPHSETAWSLNNLGIAHRRAGDDEAALDLMIQSLEMNLQIFHPKSMHVRIGYANVSTTLHMLGRYEEAEEYARQGGQRHLLARALMGQGRFDEAEQLLREIIDEQADPNWVYSTLLMDLAATLLELDRGGEAEPLLRQALVLFAQPDDQHVQSFPAFHTRLVLEATALLGATLTTLERYGEAEAVLLDGLDLARREGDPGRTPGSPRARHVGPALARLQSRLDELHEAWDRP